MTQFIRNENGSEKIYHATIVPEQLERILDEVVKNTSYRVRRREKDLDLLKEQILPNGDPKYERIKKITHNGSLTTQATMVVTPRLAYILRGMLLGIPDSFNEFLDYKKNQELIPIEQKMIGLSKMIDQVDNLNFDTKISLLKSLRTLSQQKKSGKCFDAKKLDAYYSEAACYLALQLESESKIDPEKKGSKK